jgi:transketolase
MRNRFAEVFYELARSDSLLNLIVADISPAGSIEKFRKEFPERFINVGVAEQVMVGMAAGMAQRGMKPFIYTIATFALYRPFEFIRDDICYQNLPVTIVGIGGGVTYSTLGATHHAQEDIAIASSLPNMKIISPCDPDEVEAALKWCAQDRNGGPTYLRLGKAGEPILTENALGPWEFGKFRLIRQGQNIAILTYGTISKVAQDVSTLLLKSGHDPGLYFVSTLKPLDSQTLFWIYSSFPTIVVIEEHVSYGGLAMQVRAHAQESGWHGKILSFSLPNTFEHLYGSHQDILSNFGLDSHSVYLKIIDSI